MVDDMINGLEQKINDLLNRYHYLKEEQTNYKRALAEIRTEHQALKERYEQAVNGIERMIDRLKTVQEEA